MKIHTLHKWLLVGALISGAVFAATVSRIKTFSDGDILTASDLNVEFDNVVDGVNSISNDNIATNAAISPAKISANIKGDGITRNTTTGALSVNVDDVTIELVSDDLALKDGSVDTDKLVDDSVTTAKIVDESVTRAKVAVIDQIPAGTVVMFHTFNGAATIPRGWMVLDGDIVNEANYNAIHGAGAYAADGVASSPLLAKNLPDMDERYATGNDTTTQSGASPITAVGNSGNTIDLEHSHGSADMYAEFAFDSGTTYIYNQRAAGSTWTSDRTLAVTTAGTAGVSSNAGIEISGAIGDALSTSQTIRPDSIQFIYIMKVI